MAVHSHFGPGFLEEVYKNALAVEFHRLGLYVDKEVPIPIDYQGVRVGNYQADMIVEGAVIMELKAMNMLLPRHEAQMVNYLCAAKIDDGLLINFGTDTLQYKHKYRHFNKRPSHPHPVNPVNPVSSQPKSFKSCLSNEYITKNVHRHAGGDVDRGLPHMARRGEGVLHRLHDRHAHT